VPDADPHRRDVRGRHLDRPSGPVQREPHRARGVDRGGGERPLSLDDGDVQDRDCFLAVAQEQPGCRDHEDHVAHAEQRTRVRTGQGR
jgi:hypothetical protein